MKQSNVYREIGFVYILFKWYTHAASFPPGDIILAELGCTLNDIIFWSHQE
jgi:hypothetical protein